MLEIKNISKSFDGIKAVDNFSLALRREKITSLIGPNGAGKTTLFNLITGFVKSDAGDVVFGDCQLQSLSPSRIARKGISRTFQNVRLFRNMSVLENVLVARQHQIGERFAGALFTFSKDSSDHKAHLGKANSLLEFVGLQDKRFDVADNLSYGQQKLLTIACCLAMESQLLLLDEPVAGVQPAMIEKIIAILQKLVHEERRTVLLIEHDINVVMEISDIVVVMDGGRKIAEEVPSLIRQDTRILEAYLS